MLRCVSARPAAHQEGVSRTSTRRRALRPSPQGILGWALVIAAVVMLWATAPGLSGSTLLALAMAGVGALQIATVALRNGVPY